MRLIIFFFITSTLLSVAVYASDNEHFYRYYLASYPQTAIEASKKPLNFDSSDWLKTSGIVFLVSGLFFLDEDINDTISRNRNPLTHSVADAGNLIGNGWYTIPAIPALWFYGYARNSQKSQDTALLCAKSVLFANGITTVLKYSTQRYRPKADKGNSFWNGNGFTHHRDSFPSGHTTLVWSIAPVISEQYKETKWIPPITYSLACLTGYSRIHDEKHWASDVFAGAVIGYYSAKMVLKTTPRLSVMPTIEPEGVQINLNF